MTGSPLPVLMYHGVAAVAGPLRSLAVPPRRLAEQLTALTEAGYRLVGLTEALHADADGVSEPMVAVTFDDGYADFLTKAMPVLAELGATVTLYAAVSHLGKRADWLGDRAEEFGPLLTWEQLTEVAAAGIEIGNHSLVHHPLDVLPPGQADREIAAGRSRLEQRLQLPVPSFAYPHGYHGRRVRAAVARAGHDNACEIGHRVHRPSDHRLAIPRLQPLPDHTGPDLLKLVRGDGPALLPTVKRLAQPAWRLTRRAARLAGVRLT